MKSPWNPKEQSPGDFPVPGHMGIFRELHASEYRISMHHLPQFILFVSSSNIIVFQTHCYTDLFSFVNHPCTWIEPIQAVLPTLIYSWSFKIKDKMKGVLWVTFRVSVWWQSRLLILQCKRCDTIPKETLSEFNWVGALHWWIACW